MQDNDFLQEMANKAVKSGTGITIIQNLHQQVKEPCLGNLFDMITIGCFQSAFGGISTNLIENKNEQLLIDNNDNLRNVSDDEFKMTKEYVVINENLTIPVISVKRTITWKQDVHKNNMVNTKLDPVVLIRLMLDHNTTFKYALYFKDENEFDSFCGNVEDIRNKFIIEEKQLPYVIEPNYKEENEFIVDKNISINIRTIETSVYESIFADKPMMCNVDSHNFYDDHYGFI